MRPDFIKDTRDAQVVLVTSEHKWTYEGIAMTPTQGRFIAKIGKRVGIPKDCAAPCDPPTLPPRVAITVNTAAEKRRAFAVVDSLGLSWYDREPVLEHRLTKTFISDDRLTRLYLLAGAGEPRFVYNMSDSRPMDLVLSIKQFEKFMNKKLVAVNCANRTEWETLVKLARSLGYDGFSWPQSHFPSCIIFNENKRLTWNTGVASDDFRLVNFADVRLVDLLPPEPESRIEKLIRDEGVVLSEAKRAAFFVRGVRGAVEAPDSIMFGRNEVAGFTDGSARFGCQPFSWTEIDTFAKKNGWWV